MCIEICEYSVGDTRMGRELTVEEEEAWRGVVWAEDRLQQAQADASVAAADLATCEAEAERALAEVRGWMESHQLELHPEKTRIVNSTSDSNGFNYFKHVKRGELKTMDGFVYDADYEVFCESIKRRESEARVWGQEEISKTISTGQMPTSRAWDFSQCMKPTRKRADPDEETIDWRAVCGRTAHTVRREGRV